MVDSRSYVHYRSWSDRIIIAGSLCAAIWPLTSLMADSEPLPYQDLAGIFNGVAWGLCTILTWMQVTLTHSHVRTYTDM
jgi:hypothetical protein